MPIESLDERGAIWLFVGSQEGKPRRSMLFPSAAFHSLAAAEAWIKHHRCSGILTQYPLDEGAYDWAVRNGYLKPRKPEHFLPQFIESFSAASQPHWHYEDGRGLHEETI